MKYLVLTLEDAQRLRVYLDRRDPIDGDIIRINERLRADTGANIEEIAQKLKGLEICCACVVEGQEHTCNVPDAQKLGRRLNRLLQRARGEIEPGPGACG